MVKNMSKKKKQFATLKSELHTISTLPLETVQARLYELESETVSVSIIAIDPDYMSLKVTHQGQEFFKKAEVTGRLLRWEGTYTRMDVNSRTFAHLEWLDQFGDFVQMIGVALLVSPICFSLGMLIANGSLSILIGIVLSFIASRAIINNLAPINFAKQQRYQAFKAVDKLMQGIADKLVEDVVDSTPMLEFDGSEDALTHLLQQEKFKHFHISDDGELIK